MEKRKTILNYLVQVLVIFGFSMLVMNIFSLIFGQSAKDISSMFELGNQGISVKIAFQFLGLSMLVTGSRFIFFTDTVIKKMSISLRTVFMLLSVISIMAVFIIAFNWFPIHMWQCWAMFLLCFALSFLGSYAVVTIKEKAENKQMEEALQRLKAKSANQ